MLPYPEGARTPLLIRATYALVFMLLFGYLLVVARNFLIPLALGCLLAFLLLPLSSRLERWGLTRILANLLSIIIGGGLLYAAYRLIGGHMRELIDDLPELKAKAIDNLRPLMDAMHMSPAAQQTVVDRSDSLMKPSGDSLPGLLKVVSNTVLAIGLMPVYVFMFLYYRDKFRRFILMLVPGPDKALADSVITKVSQVSRRYITGMVTVVLAMWLLNSTGFLINGLKYAVFMGLIAAVCAFVPYFGNIAGYAFVIVFALLSGAAPAVLFGLIVQFFIVQFIANNILTPNIVGNMLGVNPFFIILGVLAGVMLWGLPGPFVVVPLLGMLRVTCDHVPSLKPYGFLLSDRGTEHHTITAGKLKRLFSDRG